MKKGELALLVLVLMSLACTSQVDPAPAAVKIAPPAAPTAARVMSICLTAETVRLRMGAGTGYGEVALLSAGDKVTVTGTPVISEDMGIWTPVTFGAVSGWINARYLC